MAFETLLSHLAARARSQPDAVALTHDDRSATYADLVHAAEEQSASLAALELAARAVVAVPAVKSPDILALIVALGSLGHPVLVVSPSLGRAARTQVYADAGVAAELSIAGTDLRCDPVAAASAGRSRERQSVVSSETALILTTSGSTGVPKGVCLSKSGMEAFSSWARRAFSLDGTRRVLSFAPLNFDLSLLELWASLDAGAEVILVDERKAADGPALRRLVTAHRPDLIQGVPLLFRFLLEGATRELPPVRDILVTGEAAPQELRRRMAEAWPEARFHNVYGCTETNDSFVFSASAHAFSSPERVPIGAPIKGAAFRVVDETGGELTGAGKGAAFRVVDETGGELTGAGKGELHTATPFQALGYTDPTKNAAAFYDAETEAGTRRFYRTGDVVERDSGGALLLLGRSDLMVKVRGIRTNLQDIETVLERHPAVDAAVVCPLPDEANGSVLWAVVQTGEVHRVGSLDLRRHCADRLPRSAMPAHFILTTKPLPRTSTGKPERALIARMIASERKAA